jgi:hypothetical protein
MRLKRIGAVAIAFGLAGVVSLMTVLPGLAANVVTVTSANLHGWFFYNDETDVINNSLGSFVTGPDTPPLGVGSAQISVSGTQRRNLATYQFSGAKLADITTLKFSTYNPSVGNGGGPNRSGYLHFNVDFNGSDTWQRRLVFVPSNNGAVIQNSWQEWDAIRGGAALWGYSGNSWPVTGEPAGTAPGAVLKPWSLILTQYPGVRIRVTDAFVGIRVGEPYESGYTENIDAFKFGTASGTTEFDFEPTIGPPTNKDQCKDGGWQQFNTPVFKNQGDCVSYVASKGNANGNP